MQVLLQKLAGRHLTSCRLVRLRIGDFILAMGNFSKNKTLVGTLYPLMLTVLIGSTPAQEQTRVDEAFPCKNIENLPSVKALIDSTTFYYNKFNFSKSAEFLHKILAEEKEGLYRLDGLCRAAIYQQLTRCHDDSATLELAKNYVNQSLEADPEIWREHAHPLLSERLQRMYRKRWNEIVDSFMKKRKSWRVAIGPIIRADFSNRYGVVTGIGTTVVSIKNLDTLQIFRDQDLLIYLRLQRMRKTIERLTAGFYGEVSLSLRESEKPGKVLSFGPILSYAYQSGLEIGGTFEIARLVLGGKARISQTISLGKENEAAFSYGNFELYLRKWF